MNNKRYLRKQDVVTRTVAGENMLVPVTGTLAATQCIFVLNEQGQFIWDRLDGQQSMAAILQEIQDEFDVSPEQAQMDLTSFIEELEKESLIKEVS